LNASSIYGRDAAVSGVFPTVYRVVPDRPRETPFADRRFAKAAFVIHLRSGTKVISSRYYLPAVRRLVQSSVGRP
jgi:hypothetical protein